MWTGKHLKDARLKAQLDQKVLAKKVNIHPMTISRYETGEREPRISDLQKIAAVLNTTVAYLVGEADEQLKPIVSERENIENETQAHVTAPTALTHTETPSKILKEIASLNDKLTETAGAFTEAEAHSAEVLLKLCLENFAAGGADSQKEETA